ncbi:MAG: threonine--tRNA ligase, partial [Candidatus Parcubacteria bacterium]|nr:threonine--tRNA ligase [Candidatus Parcubacteria bacterium]
MKTETVRHSLAHILAAAVQNMFPEAVFGMGPSIENGFYYDFELPRPLTPTDLPRIEKRMKEMIKQSLSFKKENVSKTEAEKLFESQPYKLELIKEIPENEISVYKTVLPQGKILFTDLCKGPHVVSTKEIPVDAFKLTKIAGAYWKGDEKRPMLQRVYGLAFETNKELDEFILQQAEAEKRDHRIIGKNLDLFIFSDLVGKGLPLFTEKGSIIRRELEQFVVDEEIKRGYKHVYTPELAKVELYKTSGHYPYYKDTMYPIMKVDEEELILRPMTCPHHYQIYSSQQRSYRELPFKIAELAKQFRYEKSGELTGLIRARLFCLADAHIICQVSQANDEINNALDLIEYFASIFSLKIGLNYRYRLSLGDRKNEKKYFKDDAAWDSAENVLRNVLKKRKAIFFETEGDAAFYGPKIDIQMKNFAGKEETAFTVQYDFVGPKRFNLCYIDKDNAKKEPIIIHRSSIGSIERTMAFLIEYYAGALPLWLSPEQLWVIPIGLNHEKYAKEIGKELQEAGFRVKIKDENDTISKKIREGELQKIPYLLVIGDKEMK